MDIAIRVTRRRRMSANFEAKERAAWGISSFKRNMDAVGWRPVRPERARNRSALLCSKERGPNQV